MFYNIETPLLVTPGFAFNWLNGPLSDPADVPRGPDLPPRLYDAYLDFAWYPRVNQWLGAELGVRTGVWSDFDHVDTRFDPHPRPRAGVGLAHTAARHPVRRRVSRSAAR